MERGMFEYIFSKKTTEKLVDSIAERSSDKIANSVTDKSHLTTALEIEQVELEKKRLEVDLLRMDKEKREQEAKTKIESPKETFDGKNDASLKKTSWYRVTSAFIRQTELNNIQGEIKKNASPQEIQGVVQAIGQVRAARIIAMGAVLATGVGGAALTLYQKIISRQEKELEKVKKDLEEREYEVRSRMELLDKTQKGFLDSASSLNMLEGEIIKADEFVLGLCKDSSECLKTYQLFKEEGRKAGATKFEEKINLAGQGATKESVSLKAKQ